MHKLLLIMIAGGLGALSRYLLTGFAHRLFGESFPYGTFIVNISGCLLFGFLWGYLESRLSMLGLGAATRVVLLTGFMGAFTTFSTFAFETVQLLESSQYVSAAVNLAGQTVLGIAFIMLGIAASRLI